MISTSELRDRRIILAAPPFSGHLYPVLRIAMDLQSRGADCLILTGPNKLDVVRSCGLKGVPILGDRPDALETIANTPGSTNLNPFVMYGQLKRNLELLPRVIDEARAVFQTFQPELAIVDFTAVPIQILSEELELPSITVMPTPFALESDRGTPSYLGGWRPRLGVAYALRDYLGRKLVRFGKRAMTFPIRRQLRALDFSLYRSDGSEAAYSRHSILGLGMYELEFERDWPEPFRMIGPLCCTPESDLALNLDGLEGKPLVLVTLGTHLLWAKKKLILGTEKLRRTFPHYHFVYSMGDASRKSVEPSERGINFSVYPYVPYDPFIGRFSAVIHHGGAGINYACIREGIPSLIKPHDYDQFDYAARMEHFKLAVRVNSFTSRKAAEALKRMVTAPQEFHLEEFRVLLRDYSPLASVASEVSKLLKLRMRHARPRGGKHPLERCVSGN